MKGSGHPRIQDNCASEYESIRNEQYRFTTHMAC